jgi:hypothetical protein
VFGGVAASCNQGKYPDFAVAVENAEDVSKTLRFAAKHNIRVTIKNTGHDFLGRYVYTLFYIGATLTKGH